MKLSPIKFSLAVSASVHLLGFGVLFVAGSFTRAPAIRTEEAPVVLTLIAAPNEPDDSPKVAPTLVAVAQVQPQRPPSPKVAETTLPTEPDKQAFVPEPEHLTSPTSLAIVAPTPNPTPSDPNPPPMLALVPNVPQTPFHGDNTSMNPGPDATTMKGHPGVQAKPDYLKNPEPLYPTLSRRRHQEGLVILSVSVTATGKPANVRLKRSSGFPLLDDAALEAVREWEFAPARIGSNPVESEIEVPVRFNLSR